jgi:uncharacterized protein (TIGR02757 family)
VPDDLATFLEQVHRLYTRRRYLSSDPVSAVHRYTDRRDQEVAAFLAAGLAFGNVRAILASVKRALEPLGDRPARVLAGMDAVAAARAAEGFNHRWVFAPDLANLYRLLGAALREAGGLEPRFVEGQRCARPETEVGSAGGARSDIRPGAAALVAGLRALAPPEVDIERRGTRYFLPAVRGPAAAKRLFMFLRWMIRRDAVDLGLWRAAEPAQLIIPLDTHIGRLSRRLGLTGRRTAGMAMALEITAALRTLDPRDPVKYDFALSRLGILRICPVRRDDVVCAGCDLLEVCRM